MMESIGNFIDTIIRNIGSIYSESKAVCDFILSVIGIFTIHNTLYKIVGFFFTRKFKPANKKHKYAICIPA